MITTEVNMKIAPKPLTNSLCQAQAFHAQLVYAFIINSLKTLLFVVKTEKFSKDVE